MLSDIVTLGYLAVQIRQNTESLRMSAELAVSQQTADFAARVRAQPQMVKLWDAAAADPTSLSVDDKAQFRWVVAELFMIYEGQYQLYRPGHISEAAWKSKADMIRGLLENPVVAEWWSMRMAPFSQDFRDYIEGLPPSAGWKHQPISGAL